VQIGFVERMGGGQPLFRRRKDGAPRRRPGREGHQREARAAGRARFIYAERSRSNRSSSLHSRPSSQRTRGPKELLLPIRTRRPSQNEASSLPRERLPAARGIAREFTRFALTRLPDARRQRGSRTAAA